MVVVTNRLLEWALQTGLGITSIDCAFRVKNDDGQRVHIKLSFTTQNDCVHSMRKIAWLIAWQNNPLLPFWTNQSECGAGKSHSDNRIKMNLSFIFYVVAWV